MKILLFGKHGQVGGELWSTLPMIGEVIALDREDLDIADIKGLRSMIREHQPEIIINAAAYTDVDGAEGEIQLAEAVNAAAPTVMAEQAKESSALFVHYSTDYVFRGDLHRPYTEEDSPDPINVYGKTKLEGEEGIQAVGGHAFIFRTSWVYSLRGDSFVTKIMRLAQREEHLRIVEDQVGSPTWARTLAFVTASILVLGRAMGMDYLRERAGLYHVACSGEASRYELAKAILKFMHNDYRTKKVTPIPSSEFHTIAQRPANSALDSSRFVKTFGVTLPHWFISLRNCLELRN